MYFKISSLEEFQGMIKKFLSSSNLVEVEGNLTHEFLNVTIEVVSPLGWVYKAIRRQDESFTEKRIDHILSRIGREKKIAFDHLRYDLNTRRAVIFTPDYNPDGPECILACQVLVRNNEVSLSVYMRSSDIYYVLPMDIIAMDRILSHFVGGPWFDPKIDSTFGNITFHIGSAHVYKTHPIPHKIPGKEFFHERPENL